MDSKVRVDAKVRRKQPLMHARVHLKAIPAPFKRRTARLKVSAAMCLMGLSVCLKVVEEVGRLGSSISIHSKKTSRRTSNDVRRLSYYVVVCG